MAGVKVILIDTNDDVMLVNCKDEAEAEQVGSAAIWSSGGVSAYMLPDGDVEASEALIEALLDGGDLEVVEGAIS